jgi:ribosomal protein S6--L-glutamate ligase
MKSPLKAIALESRLRACRNVETLGVRPNFSDYSPEEAERIQKAGKVYYPSTFYADIFDSAGIQTFPSYHTYKCVQDKIRQTALFDLLKIPHPRSRVFYGSPRKKKSVLESFSFPFVAKIPRGSAMGRGVFLIRDEGDLDEYLKGSRVYYIQEYLPADRDIRVVIIGKKAVLSYWRVSSPGEFRSNVARGGVIQMDGVPSEAVDLALFAAARCGWDDVGMDVIAFKGRHYILEANMKYGREGFRAAGIDYAALMESLIEKGEI